MTVAELPILRPFQAPDPAETHASWHGYLTAENVEHVAARLRATLDGKRFTTAFVHEHRPGEPEVQTGCKLEPRADRVRTHGPTDESYGLSCGLSFSAGGYYFLFGTRLRRQPPWFWALEPDPEMARKLHARGEGAYLDALGFQHGPARQVLDYMEAAQEAHWSAEVVFEDGGRTVRLSQRAPVGAWTTLTIGVECELKHTRELIAATRALATERPPTALDHDRKTALATLVENAEWELGLDD